MNIRKRDTIALLLLAITMVGYAAVSIFQVDPNRQSNRAQAANRTAASAQDNKKTTAGKGTKPALPDVVLDEDSIPDSLLHPRWKIQRTTPITYDDLETSPIDLKTPDGVKYEVTYNDTINRYITADRQVKAGTFSRSPRRNNCLRAQFLKIDFHIFIPFCLSKETLD